MYLGGGEYVQPKPISRQNQKLTQQQHNLKKGSSRPREAWAGSSSPREASVFLCLFVHSSVRLFVHYLWKHDEFSRRNSNQGVHVKFSVRPPSPPDTYSYVREKSLGSTRKFVENHILSTCITNQILPLCSIHRLRWTWDEGWRMKWDLGFFLSLS